jgi:DNA topoisomerase II
MANTDDDLSKKYKKHNLRDHIYEIPGMYVGSVDVTPMNVYVYDDAAKRMTMRELQIVPALFKIVDEVVVNATDQWVRMKKESKPDSKPVKNIKIYVDKESGYIEVHNDGDSIDVEVLPEYENVYVPEMIFGQLLTSTNYGKKSVVSGVHGLGVKLCNVFSKEFSIELIDHRRKRHYEQKWTDNMLQKTDPVIKYSAKLPYTRVRFLPDYARFGLSAMTDDMYDLIRKRAFDACACTDTSVNIYFNDEKIEVKDFEKYADLYVGPKEERPRAFEKVGDSWEIIATCSSAGCFEHVSFVNGINTFLGGKHVDAVTAIIAKKIGEMIGTKKKKEIRVQHIKDNLMVFVKCSIVNPAFNSQTKEMLTTPASKFGSKCELSDKFFAALFKSGIVEKIVNLSAFHEEKKMTKTDGKKRSTIMGIENLDDANWAGTSKSGECTLILTEGLSAKTMAIAGLSVVGRDKWGVFPLRGKLMNVKDASIKKIYENEEITNIKKILGLESGKTYNSVGELRYGRVMMMCDSDVDGSHIKGLAFNMFHSLWPSLVNANGFQFMCSMLTPIVKVFKGKELHSFYNLTDFDDWKQLNNGGHGWQIKYYKGLGTSNDEEARQYFKDMRAVSYTWTAGDEKSVSEESLDLAFNKARADDRKDWLARYNRKTILDYKTPEVTYEDFVNKELIHFSNYDLERSIPSVCDGLKTSQRKILYCCFKKPLWDKEIRVAQLAAYVSENSAYHHGETSLQGAITSMAQNFVGSNNINLLAPNGQFGSRTHAGRDASQPRYIHTQLRPITGKLFIKDDTELLTYMEDDGFPVEPEWYIPILPMILVNGAVGIGTGFSTNIPCYNPMEIVGVLRRMLEGPVEEGVEDEQDLVPWYSGFTGAIEKQGAKWVSRGTFKRIGTTKVEITELPIGFWTADFKEMIEAMICDKDGKHKECPIKSYESHYTPTIVNFVLHFVNSAALDEWMVMDANGTTKLETELKLVSSKNLNTTNMYAFNELGQITKYNTALEIIKAFYEIRLDLYVKRKEHMLQKLDGDLVKLNNKIRFVLDVIQGVIIVHKLRKAELESVLAEMGYDQWENSYEYLTKIPIYNFTIDKVDELKDEIAKKEVAVQELQGTTVQNMWLNDLQAFEDVYQKDRASSGGDQGQNDDKQTKKRRGGKAPVQAKTKISMKKKEDPVL